jgi:glycosyltransferase involved in cell wall biosynthesis
MQACVIVPSFEAAGTVAAVVEDLRRVLARAVGEVFVIDDGSGDATAERARNAGARVLRHHVNLGKGAALLTGLQEADAAGFDVALTVDADGQHPAGSARAVLEASDDPDALVLGVRDLERDGAPRANRLSNGIANFFLSRFTGAVLHDTQCGLRRYPVRRTLALGVRARGYDFEAEVLMRAVAAGIKVVEKTVSVHYPDERERVTHFDSVRDPARIVFTVVRTLFDVNGRASRPPR